MSHKLIGARKSIGKKFKRNVIPMNYNNFYFTKLISNLTKKTFISIIFLLKFNKKNPKHIFIMERKKTGIKILFKCKKKEKEIIYENQLYTNYRFNSHTNFFKVLFIIPFYE